MPNPPLSALTGLRREWALAISEQDMTHLDAGDPQLVRRDLWYEAEGFDKPFPGDARVLHPWEVHTSAASGARGTGVGDIDG